MQRELVAFTFRDQGQRLTEAIGLWTQAAHLPPGDLHAKAVGSTMSKEAAALLHVMARDLATASGPESLGAASMNLAAALVVTWPARPFGVAAGGTVMVEVDMPGTINIGDVIGAEDLARFIRLGVKLGIEVIPGMQ